jgi:hypothetical protein
MSVSATTTSSASYERFAGACAFAAAAAAPAYSITFVLVLRDVGGRVVETVTALLLLAGGLLSVAAILGLYGRLRTADPGHALLAAVLGTVGGLGAAIHGAFDLANAVNVPDRTLGLPNPVDPRGFLTFGLTGLAVLAVARLVLLGAPLARRVGVVGIAAGVLLIVVYLGRMIILDAKNPLVLGSAVLLGFLVSPAFYILVGIDLRRPIVPAPGSGTG